MSEDINDVVKGMASLVLSSGRLSEFHERNLKMYGLIYFNCKSIKIDYDLSLRHDAEVDDKNNITVKKPLSHCFISYYLEVDEGANDSLDRRFEALEKSVRGLLWKDLPVEVYFNNKIAYKSRKNV